jgi:hypothetical protein
MDVFEIRQRHDTQHADHKVVGDMISVYVVQGVLKIYHAWTSGHTQD